MLFCLVVDERETQQLQHENGPLEFGRGPKRENVARCILQNPSVSRDHVRVEELASGKVRVENLSRKQLVELGADRNIQPGQVCELPLPARLHVGDSTRSEERRVGNLIM